MMSKKKKTENTEFIAFHVTEKLKKILYDLAEDDGRSFANFMRNHIEKHFVKK